jgi:hypothetical protein
MKFDRIFVLIAALAALLAGLQINRSGCAACLLLPKSSTTVLTSDTPTTSIP